MSGDPLISSDAPTSVLDDAEAAAKQTTSEWMTHRWLTAWLEAAGEHDLATMARHGRSAAATGVAHDLHSDMVRAPASSQTRARLSAAARAGEALHDDAVRYIAEWDDPTVQVTRNLAKVIASRAGQSADTVPDAASAGAAAVAGLAYTLMQESVQVLKDAYGHPGR